MNVVIYTRFSCDKQTENSTLGQLKVCHEFAQRLGYTVVGEYSDEATSGTNDRRPKFQQMIEDSKKGHFEGVVVYQLDRFARDRYDSAVNKRKLKQNGVVVMSARENITNDASGVLMEAVLEGMAEYFSKELSQKVKRGMHLIAEKGLSTGSNTPLGYKVIDKQYVIDEDKAVIVREIFRQYAEGKTITEINEYLNARQFKTTYGREFTKSSLENILVNRKYIGVYWYSDIEIKDGMPRIISDKLFYKVQEVLAMNKKSKAHKKAKEEYLLTTKLFCGLCKSLMTGVCGTSRTGQQHFYYACKNARLKKCSKKQAPKKWLEDLVIKKCREILTDKNIEIIAREAVKAAERNSDNSILELLVRQVKAYETEIANLMQAVAECPIETVRKGLYGKINQVMSDKEELEKQLAVENYKAGAKLNEEQVIFFLTKLKNSNPDDLKNRKALIAVFVHALYFYDLPDGNKRITFVLTVDGKPTEITEDILSDIEYAVGGSYKELSGVPNKHYTSFAILKASNKLL